MSDLSYIYTDGTSFYAYIDNIPYKWNGSQWDITYSPPNGGRQVFVDPNTKQYYYYAPSASVPQSIGNGLYVYAPVTEASLRVPLSGGPTPTEFPCNGQLCGSQITYANPQKSVVNWWARLRIIFGGN